MLGIDVSKATLACTLIDPTNHQVVWEATYPNTPHGVASLLGRTPQQTPWVMEPTGRYSLCVAKPASAAGRQVLMAPSRSARLYLQSRHSRAKTDRLDSKGLAYFALAQPYSEPLPAYPIKSETMEELSQLLSARKGLALSISRLEQQIEELPYAAEHLKRAVADLKRQRKELDHKIQTLTADQKRFPHVQRLRGVQGIGPVTAAAAACCLQSRSFGHSDQFVAYIGLDVGIVQSGKRQGDRGLTHQGDAELRRLLFNCARAAVLSKESPFKDQYERELKKGLSKTAAYCAIARKLARLCWSLVRHNAEYDPQRVYVQPKKKQTDSAEEPKSNPTLDNQT